MLVTGPRPAGARACHPGGVDADGRRAADREPDPAARTVDDWGAGAGSPGVVCWCCGRVFPEERVVRLGAHPEAAVCAPCSRFLHRRAEARADALRARRGLAARTRAGAATARSWVVAHGWHHGRVVGPALRFVDRFLP